MTEPTRPDPWGERLPRRLGLWSAVAVLIGSTIGSGIFRTPAVVAQKIDDVPLFLLAWVIGGVVAICGALTYAELAAAFPRSGGIYVFLREGFGPLPAFLFGWAELLIIRPGAYGAIGITSSALCAPAFGRDPGSDAIAGLAGQGRAAARRRADHPGRGGQLSRDPARRRAAEPEHPLQGRGARCAGTPGIRARPGMGARRDAAPACQRLQLSPFLLAMVSILWAYDGWADLAFVGGEVRDPQRNLPRALFIGTGAGGGALPRAPTWSTST